MTQIINKISYERNRIRLICNILLGILFFSIVAYIYLINSVIVKTSLLPRLETEISEKSIEMASLERKYVLLKNSISIEDSEKIGLNYSSKVIFISREPVKVAVLNVNK